MAGQGKKKSVGDPRENDRAFRLAFEKARNAIFWADSKTAVIVHCNRAACRFLGYTKSELVGQAITLLHPAEDAQQYLKVFHERAASSRPKELEAVVACKNGEQKNVLITLSRLDLEGGLILQGIFHDVTQHCVTEKALREREENFRALAVNATEAIVIETEVGVVYANPAALKLIGRTPNQARQLAAYDLMAPSERPRIADLTKRRLAGGPAPSRYESAITTRCGEEIPVEITAAATTWHGEPATIGMLRDISERRRQEQAIEERNQMIARAEAIAGVGSWYYRIGSEHMLFSDALLSIWGLTRDGVGLSTEGLSGVFLNMVHPEDRRIFESNFRNMMTEHVGMDCECRIRREDGTERVIHTVATIDRDVEGSPVGIVGAVWDITERRLLEQDLVEVSRREQKRIGQDLHDGLGQELLGISFLAKALERRTAKSAPEISEDARRLSELVGRSLRQARRLAHGLLPVEMDEGALASELRYLAQNIREAYDIACTCRVWDPGLVHDNKVATHLYLIAREAVANAVRHGKANRIRIDLYTGTQGKLNIEDNGTWPQGEDNGDGIGLRIMRHRASLIGGKCRFRYLPKKGTTVTCTFRNSRP